MEFSIEFFENEIYKNSNRLKEKFIFNNYRDFHSFIKMNYKGDSFLEMLYKFYKGEHFCYCGNTTKFINFKKGYLEYCSVSCSSNSEKTRNKYKKTCIDKYGVDNISKTKEIKELKEKICMDKYGVKTFLQAEYSKNIIYDKYGVNNVFELKSIQEKIKKTNLEKYGNECCLLNSDIIKKTKETNLIKYNTDHFSKTDEWKNKIKKYNLEKYINDIDLPNEYEFISKDSYINEIKHISCGEIFKIQTQLIRLRKNNNSEICTKCNKINYIKENELYEYINTLSDYKIEKYRDCNYEIDVYLPELNLGFEFNGLYWHSELFKDKNYHLNKSLYFKNKGIRIIHIWEDDWKYKSEIIKSIIKSNIIGTKERIYARDCTFEKITNKDSKEFLEKNHLQGWCVSKYRYALKYNDEIVSIITLGDERLNLGSKNNDESLELLRYANKVDVQILGGFAKLLKNFIKVIKVINNRKTKIISYSDISTFTGEIYQKNGFELIKKTSPGYSYIVKGIRKNRFLYNKQNLIKMGYDKTKSSREIMFENNFYRIYDCGNNKFEFNI